MNNLFPLLYLLVAYSTFFQTFLASRSKGVDILSCIVINMFGSEIKIYFIYFTADVKVTKNTYRLVLSATSDRTVRDTAFPG